MGHFLSPCLMEPISPLLLIRKDDGFFPVEMSGHSFPAGIDRCVDSRVEADTLMKGFKLIYMAKASVPAVDAKPKKTKDIFQKRQAQIIQKATKLFMKKGYAQTTMREISKATGIDLRNLYYFIKSKDEILYLVCQMIHTPMMEIIRRQTILDIDDPVLQLQTIFEELIEFGYDCNQELLLMYRESKSLSKKLRKVIFHQESLLVSRVEDVLKKGKERGVFQFEDASFTANFLVYGLSLHPLRSWNMKDYTKEELKHLLVKNLMSTVLA
jgi:AcrR family transcriptional regulator